VIFQSRERESITFSIYNLIARSYLSDIEECGVQWRSQGGL